MFGFVLWFWLSLYYEVDVYILTDILDYIKLTEIALDTNLVRDQKWTLLHLTVT